MNLLDRVMAEPELRDEPPVLVDVGAAGGVHPAWRRIARHAVGVGFEPDTRETAALGPAQGMFRRWVFCSGLAVPSAAPDGRMELYLTRSPQCSSVLHPRADALREWAFADLFEVVDTRMCAAVTLEAALHAEGIGRIDWLKCDTQGLDLRLFQSLPESWQASVVAVEFEPGLIDIYEGEDRAADVLAAMEREPFWLAELRVGRTPRGRSALVAPRAGRAGEKWFRRLGPDAPAWVNLRYLRTVEAGAPGLDRRSLLLNWVFATVTGQHGHALSVAAAGEQLFGGEIFARLGAASRRSVRWAMLRGVPRWIWRRLTRA